jgi:hypothetical protein
MTSVAMRLGHSFGLHREGSKPGLSPFQTELRRRLWWQIVTLDIRCCEDRASDPCIWPDSFNTKQPLNINDSDMDPQSTEPLIERKGFTDMTKIRASHIVWNAAIRLLWDAVGFTMPVREGEVNPQPTISVEEKTSRIKQLEKLLENEIVIYCDPKEPLQWVTLVVVRLVVSRFHLAIYHPPMYHGKSTSHQHVSREAVLRAAVQNLEYSHLLDTEPAVAKWQWWFNTHVQWHALAVVLVELCVQDKGSLVERAWTIVDVVFDDWAARIADSKNGVLWRAIKKLMSKAQSKRNDSKQQAPNAMPQQQLPLPQFQVYSPLQDPNLADLPYHPNSVLGYAQTLNLEQGVPPDSLSSLIVNDIDDTINWAEWDEFMQDFEMADAGTIDPNVIQQDTSQNWW